MLKTYSLKVYCCVNKYFYIIIEIEIDNICLVLSSGLWVKALTHIASYINFMIVLWNRYYYLCFIHEEIGV